MTPTDFRTAASGTSSRATLLCVSLLVWFALLGCDSHVLYEGHPAHVERRHVKLEGAQNFRDLGGYATPDGKTVRWGRFYRSDNLASLTDDDLKTVSDLGLKLV